MRGTDVVPHVDVQYSKNCLFKKDNLLKISFFIKKRDNTHKKGRQSVLFSSNMLA
jgi:hypothetical protein